MKEKVLLPVFNALVNKYGEEKALQAFEVFYQSTSTYLATKLRNELVNGSTAIEAQGKTFFLSDGSQTNELSSTEFNLDTNRGVVKFSTRNMRFISMTREEYARVPLEIKIDIKEMKGTRHMEVIVDRNKVGDNECRSLVKMWQKYIAESTPPEPLPRGAEAV